MSLTPYSMIDGISWPIIPTPLAAGLMAMQYQFEQSQWLSTAELEQRQFDQAAILLRHALDTVPHYRKKYGALAVPGKPDGDDLDWDIWRGLPMLERSEIQDNIDQMKSARIPPSHGNIREYGSSGSTGRPLKVLGSDTTHFFWLCLTLRDHIWHQRDLAKKNGSIRTKVNNATLPGWGEWSNSIASGPSSLLSIQTDVDKQLDWLLTENPDYLITHPSNLHALVTCAVERGLRPANLREVRTFGEMLQPGLRELVRQVWGIKLTDMYSAEETGYIALQCPETDSYHIQSENLLVEILNERGEPCKPGETGEVVITTLHNFAMPLIRYRILDHAEAGAPCPCGRSLPVIRRIAGRQRNMIVLPDGRSHWPSFHGDAWRAIAPVKQFQMIQHDTRTIEIKLVCARPPSAQEEAGIRAMLTEKLGYPFNFRFSYQDSIQHSPNGKFEDFISLVKARYG
jgi:phenylacetate-CoA ligase